MHSSADSNGSGYHSGFGSYPVIDPWILWRTSVFWNLIIWRPLNHIHIILIVLLGPICQCRLMPTTPLSISNLPDCIVDIIHFLLPQYSVVLLSSENNDWALRSSPKWFPGKPATLCWYWSITLKSIRIDEVMLLFVFPSQYQSRINQCWCNFVSEMEGVMCFLLPSETHKNCSELLSWKFLLPRLYLFLLKWNHICDHSKLGEQKF